MIRGPGFWADLLRGGADSRCSQTGVVVSRLLRNAGVRELRGMQMPASPAWPACRRVPV